MEVGRGERPDLLGAIVAATRRTVEAREAVTSTAAMERRCAQRRPRGAAFREALVSGPPVRVIAECKRRSPSRGVLRTEYDPARIARAYQDAGAAAVSVLTEPTFFDGALEHLAAVREAVTLPVLRKDFIVGRYQLLEAAAHGADAALLIVAAVEPGQLEPLIDTARALGLAALVEVHDAAELARALEAGADLVGVNNRNLRSLDVSSSVSEDLARRLPAHVVAVAESGLHSAEVIAGLAGAGYDAFLIGEHLMTAPSPGEALHDLLSACRGRLGPDHARRRTGKRS